MLTVGAAASRDNDLVYSVTRSLCGGLSILWLQVMLADKTGVFDQLRNVAGAWEARIQLYQRGIRMHQHMIEPAVRGIGHDLVFLLFGPIVDDVPNGADTHGTIIARSP